MSAGPRTLAGADQSSWLTRTVAGAAFAALAGSIGYVVVPLVVAALRGNAHYSEIWVGLIGSADPAGMFAGATLALLRFFHRAPRYTILITLVASMACNAVCLVVDNPSLLLTLRLLAGMNGGIALAVALAVLGGGQQPDRNFALLTLMQAAFGMIAAAVAGAGTEDLNIIYRTLFIAQLLGLAGAVFVPARQQAATHHEVEKSRRRETAAAVDLRLAVYTLLGNVFSAAGFLILWANIEALAARQGLGPSGIVAVLDTGLAGGVAGTLLTLLSDGRRHRRLICAALFCIGLISIGPLLWPVNAALIFPAVFLFQLSTAAACYGFGAVSEADRSGRLPILHILAVKAGFALAPLAASSLVATLGLQSVAPAAFITTLASMLFYLKIIARAEVVSSH